MEKITKKKILLPECIDCGSANLKEVEKDIIFGSGNPRIVEIKQKVIECQNCGKWYTNEKQSSELAKKIDAQLK